LPSETARLKQVVREMSKRRVSKRSAEPAGPEHRKKVTDRTGRTRTVLTKGHHQGRPKGARSKVPQGVRASVKAILEDVVSKEKRTVRDAVVDGIRSGPRHADRYLRLAAEYVDGKPTDNVNLNARFNQDELGSARELLGKKLDGILGVLIRKEKE
jgi:hypothetical protein